MFFENAASVLREVCTAMWEREKNKIEVPKHNLYGLPDNELPLESIEFTTLVNHVLNNVPEPRDLDKLPYRFFQTASVYESGKQKFLVLCGKHGQESSLPKLDDVVIVSYKSGKKKKKMNNKRSCVVKIVESDLKFYLVPHIEADSVSVYHATPVIAAANSLRVMRNSCIAHASLAQLEDDKFREIVEQVEKDYKVLMDKFPIGEDVCQDLIAKFNEIINSMSIYIYESASYEF